MQSPGARGEPQVGNNLPHHRKALAIIYLLLLDTGLNIGATGYWLGGLTVS